MIVRGIISFDLTGTLTTFRLTERFWLEELPRLFAQKNELELKKAQERLFRAYREVGEERLEWYDLKYWFRRFGLGDGWKQFLESLSQEVELYPEAQEVVERLSRDYELVLLSNAAREFIELETKEIRHCFKKLFSCVSDFGQVKKTPEFFVLVCRELRVKPEELIHVGDHFKFDFLAPQQAGVRAFYLDRSLKSQGSFILHDLRELEGKLSQ